MKRDVLDALLADRRAKRPVVLATWLATGEQMLLHPGETLAPDHERDRDRGSDIDIGALAEAARVAASADRSTVHDSDRGEVFLRVYNPPLRLVVVGAVHIAQALCPMARMAGFEVIIIDPRSAFASAERFPDVTRVTDWPDEAIDALAVDARTAVVTLTHDPKLDEPALARALASPAFYIGALGSRKTQAGRLARLGKQGFDDAALARVHGPIGLAIGAAGAAEIAIAILAEIIKVLRDPAHGQAHGQEHERHHGQISGQTGKAPGEGQA